MQKRSENSFHYCFTIAVIHVQREEQLHAFITVSDCESVWFSSSSRFRELHFSKKTERLLWSSESPWCLPGFSLDTWTEGKFAVMCSTHDHLQVKTKQIPFMNNIQRRLCFPLSPGSVEMGLKGEEPPRQCLTAPTNRHLRWYGADLYIFNGTINAERFNTSQMSSFSETSFFVLTGRCLATSWRQRVWGPDWYLKYG